MPKSSPAQTLPTLLIVEDDAGLQKQMRWAFDGYQVVVAGDRDSAVAALRRHEPLVVTLDLGLPPDPDNTTEGFRILEDILELAPLTQGHRAHRPKRPRQRAARGAHGRL